MKNGISLNQFFAIKTIVVSLFYATICLSVQSSFAQQSGWDPAEYLKDRDQNGNGQLDQDEMGGRLRRYLDGLGFSTEQPVPIADVINRARNGNKSVESERKSSSGVERKVPGFGEAAEKNDGVLGFSSSGSDTTRSIEREFGDEIMRRVQKSLERYDQNGNNRLEPSEIERARWGRPSPQESDVDNDGNLSLRELAMRYAERSNSNNRRSNNKGDGDSNERTRENEEQSSEDEERGSENWGGGGFRRGSRGGSNRSRESSGKTSDSEARAKAKERAREELAARSREQESKQEQSEADDTESESSSSAKTNRYVKFTDGIMRQLDKDSDGALNEEEMKKFRRPPANADANGDGSVTREELLQAYSPNESESSESSRAESSDSSEERERESSSRFRSKSNRSSRSSRSKSSGVFSDKDANGDGLLQMHEFTDEWTMEKINEFKAIDLNNNGILTSDEYRNRER